LPFLLGLTLLTISSASSRRLRWKITDEDRRNRDKWDAYETHVYTMLSTTNTPWAPWVVVESEDKKYGRIKVLETIVSTLRRELD